ncbi:MAG: cell division protein ZapA [Deltaproteobacteria bacterium]|nr:cell division protein ZapA [Deltaproteobacteria bacterium]
MDFLRSPKYQPGPNDQPGRRRTEDVELTVVTVKIFGRDYRFKSNSPALVADIAALIAAEAQEASRRAALSHEMDLAAHAAFRLARELIRCRRALASLTDSATEAEKRVQEMTSFIDDSLES